MRGMPASPSLMGSEEVIRTKILLELASYSPTTRSSAAAAAASERHRLSRAVRHSWAVIVAGVAVVPLVLAFRLVSWQQQCSERPWPATVISGRAARYPWQQEEEDQRRNSLRV
jgi:hypothetical protein